MHIFDQDPVAGRGSFTERFIGATWSFIGTHGDVEASHLKLLDKVADFVACVESRIGGQGDRCGRVDLSDNTIKVFATFEDL